MPAIAYTVVATLPSETLRSEYIRWLQDGHIAAVLAGGAQTGHILRIDDPPGFQVETRYTFPSRAVLDTYIRDTAPALRAEGLRLFGPDKGVRYDRRIGTIL
jgi:hypothetical protein